MRSPSLWPCSPSWRKTGDSTSKHLLRQRVRVVEVDHAWGGHAVLLGSQLQLRYQPAHSPGERRDDDRADTVRHWVTRKDEHGSVAARRRGEPDLTSLHRPSPPTPRLAPRCPRPSGRARPRLAVAVPRPRRPARWPAEAGADEAPPEAAPICRCQDGLPRTAPTARRSPQLENSTLSYRPAYLVIQGC